MTARRVCFSHGKESGPWGSKITALGGFLMAPAFYMTGFEQFTPHPPNCPVVIVHGWHDDVVPWQNSACFAEPAKAKLVMLDDDHRLIDSLDEVAAEFEHFLQSVG